MTSNKWIIEKVREFFPKLMQEKEEEASRLLEINDVVGFCALLGLPRNCYENTNLEATEKEKAFDFYEQVLVKEIVRRVPSYGFTEDDE